MHWPQLSFIAKCIVMASCFPDTAFPTSLVAKLEDGLGQSFGIVEERHVDSCRMKMSRGSHAAANRMGKLWSAPCCRSCSHALLQGS